MALSSVPNQIHRTFDTLDENGDGRLSLHEISYFLKKIGICLSEEELKSLVTTIAQSEDGSLRFEEFVGFYQSLVEEINNEDSEDECLMEAFKMYDMNDDGYISSAELDQVLCNLGLISQGGHVEECQKMICRYDSNSDGLIDFFEFKNMMTIN